MVKITAAPLPTTYQVSLALQTGEEYHVTEFDPYILRGHGIRLTSPFYFDGDIWVVSGIEKNTLQEAYDSANKARHDLAGFAYSANNGRVLDPAPYIHSGHIKVEELKTACKQRVSGELDRWLTWDAAEKFLKSSLNSDYDNNLFLLGNWAVRNSDGKTPLEFNHLENYIKDLKPMFYSIKQHILKQPITGIQHRNYEGHDIAHVPLFNNWYIIRTGAVNWDNFCAMLLRSDEL